MQACMSYFHLTTKMGSAGRLQSGPWTIKRARHRGVHVILSPDDKGGIGGAAPVWALDNKERTSYRRACHTFTRRCPAEPPILFWDWQKTKLENENDWPSKS